VQTGLTNARTEGYNRIVKHAGRTQEVFRQVDAMGCRVTLEQAP
jgi:hypothetical protein